MPHLFRLVSVATAGFCNWPSVVAAQSGQYLPARYGTNPANPQQAQFGQAQPWHTQPAPAMEAEIEPCEICPCEESRIVARVGGEVVLASDVISLFVREYLDKLDKPVPHEEREQLIRGRLKYHTELKLIYLDAKRTIPEEAMPRVKEGIAEHFEEKEIKNMMKAAKVDSRQGLEDKLRMFGSSIERQKHIFIERALAMQWLQQQASAGKRITHEIMLEYYNEHIAEYEHTARARWEELAVEVSGQSDREKAFTRIAGMGNVVQDGASFSDIAKNGSDGITAHEGGVRDWTTKGSLVSEEIDRAIFSLPVAALSPIIESKRGFHIVRVIEREDAHRTPFFETQRKIRKTIRQRQKIQGRKEYMAKLVRQTKVWTIFDKPALQADRRGASGERER